MIDNNQFAELQKQAKRGPGVREATAEERGEATKRLKKLGVGAAGEPGWQSRIFVRLDDDKPVLAVDEAMPVLGGPEEAPWLDAMSTHPVRVFYGLDAGVALLQDPARNPEVLLARRRELVAKHKQEEEENHARNLASLKSMVGGTRDEREAKERERQRWNPSGWANLPDMIRFALRLAYLVEQRDTALAADLTTLAREANRGGPSYPQREWWRDLGAD